MRRWIVAAILLLAAAASLTAWVHSSETSAPSVISSASDLGLLLVDTEEGVSVLGVQDKSIAESVDIFPGDLLLQINGIPLSTAEMLDSLLANADGDEFLIRLQRRNDLLSVKISLRSIIQ